MGALPPDDADPTNRERSAHEVDAEFAAIISGISAQMSWGTTAADLDSAAGSAGDPGVAGVHPAAADPGIVDGQVAAAERARRRELRRAQRAEEVELFEASQAAAAAELQADDAHFIPPDPPPVPRPRRRTVIALLLMALGLAMLIAPGVLQVPSDAVLVLAICCLLGGFGMLVYGLRPHPTDPNDADGWDDGARL